MRENLAIVGANGKMGSLLCEELKDKFNIIKVTEENRLEDFSDLSFVVDFASSDSSVSSARFCAKNNIPILIASTGQDENQMNQIIECSKRTPIMVSSNLSIGICLIKKMVDSVVNKYDYDITIYEKHHKTKKDKPSGTAKSLKQYICEKIDSNKDSNIEILSERGGKEVGFHSLNFYLEDEMISISHTAYSRQAFIKGAVLAIDFMKKQTEKRIYNFDEVFN